MYQRDRWRTTILIFCFAAFIALGISVNAHAFGSLDKSVAYWFQQRITPARTIFAFVITQVGSDVFTLAATAVIALYLRKRYRYWYERLLITVVGGMILNEILKFVFYRQRPNFFHPLQHLYTNSFPSGHTVSAMVLFGMLIILTPLFTPSRLVHISVIAFAIVMIVLVAGSRIYLGVHYFSDIIGGLLEAVGWINGVGIILDRKYAASTSLTRRYGTSGSS